MYEKSPWFIRSLFWAVRNQWEIRVLWKRKDDCFWDQKFILVHLGLSLFRRICLDGSYFLFHSSGLSQLLHQNMQDVSSENTTRLRKVCLLATWGRSFTPWWARHWPSWSLGIHELQPGQRKERSGATWGKRTELSSDRGTSYPMTSKARKKI